MLTMVKQTVKILESINIEGELDLNTGAPREMLQLIAEYVSLEYVSLLEKVLKVKYYDSTLLHAAVDSGNLETIKMILVYAQQLDIVNFMFGSNLNGQTPVYRALVCWGGEDLSEVMKLLRQYAEKSKIDFDSLEKAAKIKIEYYKILR